MTFGRYLTSLMLIGLLLVVGLTTASAAEKPTLVKITVDSQHYGYEGYRAMDGDPGTMWHTQFNPDIPGPHQITIDLVEPRTLSGFTYLPRPGGGNGTIADYEVYVSDDAKKMGEPVLKSSFTNKSALNEVKFARPVTGRYFRLVALKEVAGNAWTSIAELVLLAGGGEKLALVAAGNAVSGPALPGMPEGAEMGELEMQYVSLLTDINRLSHFTSVADQTFIADSLITAEDKSPIDVVIRRTRALIADLRSMDNPPKTIDAHEKQLDALADKASTLDADDAEAHLALFREVCALRRKIAFSNPLLDFDKLLFIKRHRSTFNHMCDQYYGINSVPGGSVYVLDDPLGEEPTVTDLLAESVVENGRLAGTKLQGGTFVAPDLSFEGDRIALAYVEKTGDTAHRYHTDPSQGHWHEGQCYHIFTVNTDGTNLRQLTDGTWNDFDPCWLPNGRIAFITERRGGYLRCGRVCPTYTLFDMADDGSQIYCLSYHETNEWHPSVTHDGRIIYTRWDYVDRHGCTAHMPWITTLDGRDSRAVHGNFAPRPLRPDMELDCRAVPGSQKFMATAAPHHGQAYGSIILFDPRVQDDDIMAPVKRVTPEVGFPETQGGAQVYGTPWPLSEKYFLCVYDSQMKPGAGRQGQAHLRGNYGIYLVDAFGNRELIYRDPTIACLSPMPLRPRKKPVAMAEQIVRTFNDEKPYVAPAEPGNGPKEATMGVIDIYKSFKDWPEGTRIKELRVVQILPMTVPSGPRPHETGLRLPSAKDSVNLCRYVLGTVPVEEDGSAHFIVPARKEIFFQALDEDGLAIQSMRSATYLQEGDNVVCIGCHEPKTQTPERVVSLPTALRRAPSRLKPDVEGSNPFSYAHLVQPVLDAKCVECHQKNADNPRAMNLGREPIQNKWYASYNNLAPNWGFWNYGDGYRTTPGRFGAKASRLYPLLKEGHYDVSLTEEEMHRLTLWLDLSTLFYGVYEKEGGEAQLRGEVVYPTLE